MIFQVLRLQHIPQLSVPHGCQVAVWQSRQKGAVQSTCGHPMLPKALQRAWPGVFFGTILTFGDCTIKKNMKSKTLFQNSPSFIGNKYCLLDQTL